MALSEFEIKKVDKAVEKFMQKRRPPSHIRDKLDFGYRIKNQSIELFEIRPVWNNPEEKIEEAIAKATYQKKYGRSTGKEQISNGMCTNRIQRLKKYKTFCH
jgi:hypothetical protein